MAKSKLIARDTRVLKEVERLRNLYKDMPKDTLSVVEGLVIQAARLRIMLDDMWKDIDENGDTELFTQSEKTDPYERERPVARLYNTRDTNYQRVMKQLTDLLPKENTEKKEEDDGFDAFVMRR